MKENKKYDLGLTDCFGNHLYSDDVISFGEHKGTISYSNADCRFIIKWEDGTKRPMDSCFAKCIVKCEKE